MATLQKIIKMVNGNQITFKWVPDKDKLFSKKILR